MPVYHDVSGLESVDQGLDPTKMRGFSSLKGSGILSQRKERDRARDIASISAYLKSISAYLKSTSLWVRFPAPKTKKNVYLFLDCQLYSSGLYICLYKVSNQMEDSLYYRIRI